MAGMAARDGLRRSRQRPAQVCRVSRAGHGSGVAGRRDGRSGTTRRDVAASTWPGRVGRGCGTGRDEGPGGCRGTVARGAAMAWPGGLPDRCRPSGRRAAWLRRPLQAIPSVPRGVSTSEHVVPAHGEGAAGGGFRRRPGGPGLRAARAAWFMGAARAVAGIRGVVATGFRARGARPSVRLPAPGAAVGTDSSRTYAGRIVGTACVPCLRYTRKSASRVRTVEPASISVIRTRHASASAMGVSP